ncbi:hypothetical protein ACIQU3_06730 [Streptomyces sp. NPDC101110]|uniref:hypothetical protein n=1 Tax=Streptomyces sp. NPDC101110 TaxID=3366104 RepID=UPI00382F0A57
MRELLGQHWSDVAGTSTRAPRRPRSGPLSTNKETASCPGNGGAFAVGIPVGDAKTPWRRDSCAFAGRSRTNIRLFGQRNEMPVPGVDIVKRPRPVIMGRSLKVIDEKFLVATGEASPPWGAC